MSRKIKLIWDFRGVETHKIAEHHCAHLKEFVALENLKFYKINSREISEFYSTAYIVVDEIDLIRYRDALKPHRGEIAG